MKQMAFKRPHRSAFRRKWWQLIIMMLAFATANAQSDSTRYTPINSYGVKYKRHTVDSVLLMPLYNSPHTPYRAGALKYRESDSSLYKWTGTQWLKVQEGGTSTTGIDTVYTQDDTVQVIVTPGETYYTIINSPYTEVIDDNTIVIGDDTLTVNGVLNTNTGSGYRFVIPSTQQIKTFTPSFGLLLDSTINSGSITGQVDSFSVLTRGYGQYKIDSLAGELTGGSGTDNANAGAGYRLLIPGTQEIKTLFPKWGNSIDSTTNSDALTLGADSTHFSTIANRTKGLDSLSAELRDVIADTASAIRADFPSGGGSTLVKDLGASAKKRPLPETKMYVAAKGVASNDTVTNYSYGSVDSTLAYFSSTRHGTSGHEYGGWLANGTSGDSIRVTAPFWVIIGDSQAEGHSNPTSKHSRIHVGGNDVFQWDYPDSAGQISYHLRALTKMRWFNHGRGSQTTAHIRARFYRDVLGQLSPGTPLLSTQTLPRKPMGVVIIAGINDLFNGMTIEQTKENLEWMAQVCQQNGIQCVILNLPGDAISGQVHLRSIAEINEWMASGVFDQYGASVVDYNTWWNDPAYGNDNIHHNSLIADDIHPTPVGYDSLANFIFREAKLPVLTKATFYMENDPGGFTGYSRPTDIAIDNVSYALSGSVATIDITDYVPDTVWIRIDASTNVTGTSYTGFNHIVWFCDNNPTNITYYTQRTNYSGSQRTIGIMDKVKAFGPVALASNSSYPIVDVRHNDSTYKAFTGVISGGDARWYVNMGTNTSEILASAKLQVWGNLASNGVAWFTGTSPNRFGSGQITSNSGATSTGYGISFNNAAGPYPSAIWLNGTAASGKSTVRIGNWNNVDTVQLNGISGSLMEHLRITLGAGNAGNTNQVVNALAVRPIWAQRNATHTGLKFRGIYYNSTDSSLTNVQHDAMLLTKGDVRLNAVSGQTYIGLDSNSFSPRKLYVNGSIGANIDSIETVTDIGSDYVQVIDASTGKFKKITGANLGVGSGSSPYIYQFISTQQVTVSNTATETTIYGTGEGSAGIDGSSNITTGTQIVLKGAGTIDTDGVSAGTPTLSFTLGSSTVSIPISGLANGLNDSPYSYEYKAIPLGTGTSQSYIWFMDIYVENNTTPLLIKLTGRETSALTTTGTVTASVTVEWDVADSDNTWVANYSTIELFKK
jgi:lysophospholipase L1-like esterase